MSGTFDIPDSPSDLAYAAGLLDGEGSISIAVSYGGKNPNHTLKVAINNTSRDMIQWLVDTFGGRVHTTNSVHVWNVPSEHIVDFLRAVRPYLTAKRAQSGVAIEFRKTKGCGWGELNSDIVDKRELLRHEMSDLNKTEEL